MLSLQPHEFVYVFAASCVISWLIVATRGVHGVRSARWESLASIQACHLTPTPRLGGVAIVVALVATLYAIEWRDQILFLWLSLVPLVVAGLREDLGFPVRPAWRLAAAAFGSAIFILLQDRWLVRFDIPGVDLLMGLFPVAFMATVFATTAVSHSFNLVDGLNGLCLGVALTASIALAIIAEGAGDARMAEPLWLISAAVLGVLVWNYPKGKIFLGDAGAYALGFVLSWMAIAIVWRNPGVSAWSMLLTLFWPVADTTFAIWRRLRRDQPVAAPDNRHMHHLVLRLVEACWLGEGRRHIANPTATLVMAPFFIAPALVGALVWRSPLLSFVAVVAFSILYISTYGALIRAIRKYRRPPVRQFAFALEKAGTL